MNTHTKYSRQRILVIVATTFLFHTTHIYAADNEQPFESSTDQETRAIFNPSPTDQSKGIMSHINSVVQASTVALSSQLNVISGELETILPDIGEAIEELGEAVADLDTAVAALQTDIDALEVQIDNLETVVADIPTLTEIEDALNAQTAILQGEDLGDVDMTVINDAVTDIQGEGFVSADNSLVAITAAIAAIPATDISTLATLANQTTQGLVALATSAQAEDIQGEGFVSADNSLVAITAAIAAIPATDISTLATLANQTTQGLVPLATSDQAADILTAVQTDIPADISAAVSPLATSAELTSAVEAIEGTGFISADNSLVAITAAIAAIPATDISTLATLANQTTQGLVPLATSDQAVAIQGSGFTSANSLVNLATSSALSTVDGHVTTLGTSALATAAALGTPVGASISADIAAVQADVNDTNSALSNGTTGLGAIKTAVTTLGTAALATAAIQTSQGTTINNINTAIGLLPTSSEVDGMIDAQTLALQGATTTNTLTALAGTGFVADTNSLVNICGTSFNSTTDSLKVISDNIDTLNTAVGTTIPATLTAIQATLTLLVAQFASPVTRTTTAAANPALTTTLTSSSTATGSVAAVAVYNASLSIALGLIPAATATSTQSITRTNNAITAVNTAITDFNALNAIWIGSGLSADRPSSTYSVADIIGALNQLHTALQFLLSDQTAAV